MASQIPHFHPDLSDGGIPGAPPHTEGRGGRYRRERSSPPQNEAYRTGGDEPLTPTSDIPMQDAMLAQQAGQPRNGPGSAGGHFSQSPGQRNRYPPIATNGGPNSRACPQPSPTQAHPPSYPGPPGEGYEDMSPNARSSGQPPRRRAARHARRLSGSSEPTSGPLDAGGRNAASNPASPGRGPPEAGPGDGRPREPRAQQQQSPAGRLADPGSGMDRVSSPSIAQSVLQPLEMKMREYYGFMEEEQRKMTELDAELRALQEQRQQAEERFLDAKQKHDEYERQHMDVERALRGEFQQRQPQPQPPQQQQQQQVAPSASWTMARAPSMESFDERPSSGRSGGGTSKGRSRFRMSLFK